MRITGGSLRGRSLIVPKGARPTSGRVREALFGRWQRTTPGSRFLDLFAGGGSVGLEAVSRGAHLAVCVERDRKAIAALRGNCRRLEVDACQVVEGTALEHAVRVRELGPFGHVFADPPYAFDGFDELLESIGDVLEPTGEAAIEHSRRSTLPIRAGGLQRTAERRYGESVLSFYRSVRASGRQVP